MPDETRRVPLLTYPGARPAAWPRADYIVGNPPFLGNKRMRDDLGDGYTEALRAAYPEVPESADFVMYWWHKAAALTRTGAVRRFGLITTNSLRQTFNRRVVQQHLSGEKLAAPIPAVRQGHPDAEPGAPQATPGGTPARRRGHPTAHPEAPQRRAGGTPARRRGHPKAHPEAPQRRVGGTPVRRRGHPKAHLEAPQRRAGGTPAQRRRHPKPRPEAPQCRVGGPPSRDRGHPGAAPGPPRGHPPRFP